jgi:hypothetical protein
MIYRAPDGKEFNNLQEATDYENKYPWLYAITVSTRFGASIVAIALSKEQANIELEKFSGETLFSTCYIDKAYRIIPPTKGTVTPKEFKKAKEQHTSCWLRLKEVLCGTR